MAKDNLTPGYAIKVFDMPSVDTSAIAPPWDEAIASLQQIIFVLPSQTEADKQFALLVDADCTAALHWLYKKKWNKRFRLPYPREIAKKSEPLGDIFLGVLNLCESLHTIGLGSEYRNAGQWFYAVACDLKALWLEQAATSSSTAADLKFIRDLTKSYREEEVNPHDKEKDKYPHLWALVECAMEVRRSGRFPEIIKRFWIGQRSKEFLGFIGAWSAYGTFINRHPGVRRCYLKDGKILARSPTKQRKDENVFSLQKV